MYNSLSLSLSFSLSLSNKSCEELEDGQKKGITIASTLTILMTKMDDVKLMKRGMMAYFKVGVYVYVYVCVCVCC